MNDMSSLQLLLNQFLAVVPRLTGALVILIVGVIAAKVIASILKKLLVTAKVDRLADKINEVDFFRQSEIEVKISEILPKILYYMLILMFVIAACDALGLAGISVQLQRLVDFIPQALSALIIFVGGAVLASALKEVVASSLKSLGVTSGRLIANVIFYFLLITIAVSALAQAGMNTGFIENNFHILLLGIASAFALGYGLASKSTIENFLAGTYNRKRYNIGDEIQVGNIRGIVVAIDNTSVTLEANARHIIVPQKTFSENTVEIFHKTPSSNE